MSAPSRSSSSSRGVSPTLERPQRSRRASVKAAESGALISSPSKDSLPACEPSAAILSLESPDKNIFGSFMSSLDVNSPARISAFSPASQPPTISKPVDERITFPNLLQMKGSEITDLNSKLANEALALEVIKPPTIKYLLNFVAAKVNTQESVKAMHDKEIEMKDAQFNSLQVSTIKLKHQFDAQTRRLNNTAQNQSNAPEEKQRKVRSTVPAYASHIRFLTCSCALFPCTTFSPTPCPSPQATLSTSTSPTSFAAQALHQEVQSNHTKIRELSLSKTKAVEEARMLRVQVASPHPPPPLTPHTSPLTSHPSPPRWQEEIRLQETSGGGQI